MEQETVGDSDVQEIKRQWAHNEISYLEFCRRMYRDRIVALLADHPGLGIKEIARLLPCSENTARKWKRGTS